LSSILLKFAQILGGLQTARTIQRKKCNELWSHDVTTTSVENSVRGMRGCHVIQILANKNRRGFVQKIRVTFFVNQIYLLYIINLL